MKVICIDDEQLALDYLEAQLQKMDDVEVIGAYLNPMKALDEIVNQQVDVAMIDIQMPEINGLELAEEILEQKPETFIVFITAYSQFAVDAFQINAIDYIIKPITMNRLQNTIERIKKLKVDVKQDTLPSQVDLKIKIAPFLEFEVKKTVYKPLQWRTAKAEELFIYLLQNRNILVEKSSIIDLLWGEYDVEKGYALLYTTIYNVRRQLILYKKYMTLKNRSNGYILELHHVEIDIVKWERNLYALGKIDDETITSYEKVMQLNRGSYLVNYDYIWLEGDRHRIDRLWLHTANQMALYYLDTNKTPEALKWYSAILERHPSMEEAHFNLMKLYEADGDFTLMMQQYNALNKALRQELAGKPSDYIVDWYVGKMK